MMKTLAGLALACGLLCAGQGAHAQNATVPYTFSNQGGYVSASQLDQDFAAGLVKANNLADLPSPASARINLGLGALAQQNALTTGQVVSALGFAPAPLLSPQLSGTPTAPTASLSDASTQIANDAFVQGVVGQATQPNDLYVCDQAADGCIVGADANPGTLAQPLATWAKAMSVLRPGQRLYCVGVFSGLSDVVVSQAATLQAIVPGDCTLKASASATVLLELAVQHSGVFATNGVKLDTTAGSATALQFDTVAGSSPTFNFTALSIANGAGIIAQPQPNFTCSSINFKGGYSQTGGGIGWEMQGLTACKVTSDGTSWASTLQPMAAPGSLVGATQNVALDFLWDCNGVGATGTSCSFNLPNYQLADTFGFTGAGTVYNLAVYNSGGSAYGAMTPTSQPGDVNTACKFATADVDKSNPLFSAPFTWGSTSVQSYNKSGCVGGGFDGPSLIEDGYPLTGYFSGTQAANSTTLTVTNWSPPYTSTSCVLGCTVQPYILAPGERIDAGPGSVVTTAFGATATGWAGQQEWVCSQLSGTPGQAGTYTVTTGSYAQCGSPVAPTAALTPPGSSSGWLTLTGTTGTFTTGDTVSWPSGSVVQNGVTVATWSAGSATLGAQVSGTAGGAGTYKVPAGTVLPSVAITDVTSSATGTGVMVSQPCPPSAIALTYGGAQYSGCLQAGTVGMQPGDRITNQVSATPVSPSQTEGIGPAFAANATIDHNLIIGTSLGIGAKGNTGLHLYANVTQDIVGEDYDLRGNLGDVWEFNDSIHTASFSPTQGGQVLYLEQYHSSDFPAAPFESGIGQDNVFDIEGAVSKYYFINEVDSCRTGCFNASGYNTFTLSNNVYWGPTPTSGYAWNVDTGVGAYTYTNSLTDIQLGNPNGYSGTCGHTSGTNFCKVEPTAVSAYPALTFISPITLTAGTGANNLKVQPQASSDIIGLAGAPSASGLLDFYGAVIPSSGGTPGAAQSTMSSSVAPTFPAMSGSNTASGAGGVAYFLGLAGQMTALDTTGTATQTAASTGGRLIKFQCHTSVKPGNGAGAVVCEVRDNAVVQTATRCVIVYPYNTCTVSVFSPTVSPAFGDPLDVEYYGTTDVTGATITGTTVVAGKVNASLTLTSQ